jgi:hypothetical protein
MKQRNYLVSYKLKGQTAVSKVVATHDPLAFVLDEVGAIADQPGAFERLVIRSECTGAKSP